MKSDPELLKTKRKDEEIKKLKNKTGKHGYENKLKSLIIDGEYYKKKCENLNERKLLVFFTRGLIGSGPAITTSTLSLVNPSIGITIASFSALLTSMAILITNKYISNLKIRYTKLPDWINVITLLIEKTLKQSMIDRKLMKMKLMK